MKALVTGATGFTGSYTVPLLIEKGIAVKCFVRPSSDLHYLPISQIELCYGDLSEIDSLVAALADVDILVNIASLGFGHAQNLVDAALKAKVKRAVFVSTTALFTALNAASKAVRISAEETIIQSTLDYTILRPTMIYGNQRDRNMYRLLKFLQASPIIPVFGSGNYLQQPIYVGDVAKAIVQVALQMQTIGKIYNISGKAPLTYNEVIDTVAQLLKKKVYRLHLPVKGVITLLDLLARFSIPFPIRSEQVLRLNEDKAFAYTEASADFDFRPLAFCEGLRLELEAIGLR